VSLKLGNNIGEVLGLIVVPGGRLDAADRRPFLPSHYDGPGVSPLKTSEIFDAKSDLRVGSEKEPQMSNTNTMH